MKKVLFIIVLMLIPICVSANTAIDPYGNEYEVYEETPKGFSEDNIAKERDVTSYAPIETTTTSKVTEAKKEKKDNSQIRKIIAYGILGIAVIIVLIFLFIFMIKATIASNMY